MKKCILIRYSIVLFLMSFFSCAEEESRISPIPNARVEIDINTILNHQFNNPYHSKKYYPNSEGVFYAGYVGVIVISNVDASWVYAFDLCCPHDVSSKKELINKNDLQLECPTCKSVFNIGDGSGANVSGPAKERLKRYNVGKSGATYRIRN